MQLGKVRICSFQPTNTTVFCFDDSEEGIQKVRQCDPDETAFRLALLSILILLNLMSLLASLKLRKIINYVSLYKASRTFLCFETEPVLHRSAVFQLIESDADEDVKLFNEIFNGGKDMSPFINRPNSRGRTPLHEACEKQKSRKMLQLLNAGAKSVPDAEGREPKLAEVFIAIVRSDSEEDLKLIFEGSNLSANFINRVTASGQTALHAACDNKSPRVMFQLLNAGAKSLPDNDGAKPKWERRFFALSTSDRLEDKALVEEIMTWDNFVSIIKNNPMLTDFVALTGSDRAEDVDLFERVLRGTTLASFVNQPSSTRMTGLHVACEKKSLWRALLLLRAGAQLQSNTEGLKPMVENLFERSPYPPRQEEYEELKNDKEKLILKLQSWLGEGGWANGIHHIVESPDCLVELLQTWDAADPKLMVEAEQKIKEMFGRDIKVITLPLPSTLGEEEREKVKERVNKWNSNHDLKCEYPSEISDLLLGVN